MEKHNFAILHLVLVMGVMLLGCGKQNASPAQKEDAEESGSSSDIISREWPGE